MVGSPTKFEHSEAKIGESASVQYLLTLYPQKTRQPATSQSKAQHQHQSWKPPSKFREIREEDLVITAAAVYHKVVIRE